MPHRHPILMAHRTVSHNATTTRASSRFAFTAKQLSSLHNPKNLHGFREFGGLAGLEDGLHTNRTTGLNGDQTTPGVPPVSAGGRRLLSLDPAAKDELLSTEKTREIGGVPASGLFVDRKRAFLDNRLPTKRQPTFLQLLWMTYNDPVLFLLTAAAAVSLALGLYQALATTHQPGQPSIEWVEGVAIIVAVVIIVLVGSLNDWKKLRQFQKLNRKQLERDVKVTRSNVPGLIPISEVLVGDVVNLEPGDVIPADGILINGYNIICDESAATGESDHIHKQPGDEVYRALEESGAAQNECTPGFDPFLLSGTKIIDGIGTFMVTATGLNSTYGKILSSLEDNQELTPLQQRLAVLAKYIARAGAGCALLLFAALLVKFLAQLPHDTQTSTEKGKVFIEILIISLTVLVIAVPEGLPLAVTLSLAYATTRMLKDHNLVRRLQACETMGNVTNICSDKTGTLTQNDMRVVAGTVGVDAQFRDQDFVFPGSPDVSSPPQMDTKCLNTEEFLAGLSDDVKTLLTQSIALNTTAIEGEKDANFIGSGTESALLKFARSRLGMGPARRERSSAKIVQFIPFNALRQCMATVIELPHEPKPRYRVFIKGASEVMLAKCSKVIEDPSKGCLAVDMSDRERQTLTNTIESYASQALRTMSLVYRDFSPPPSLEDGARSGQTDFMLDDLLTDTVFLSVVGIRDPLRPSVAKAVEDCRGAGIIVRMVTGDNIRTAKAIAEQSGIIKDQSDLVVEGAEFRAWTDDELDSRLPHLKVIARSSPGDKKRLVVRLKDKGEIVAVTGDGTNDVAALSAADISFSMGGLSGTEVAREASSIIMMNDDFSCVVQALMWGRCVDDSVKKFLQVGDFPVSHK